MLWSIGVGWGFGVVTGLLVVRAYLDGGAVAAWVRGRVRA